VIQTWLRRVREHATQLRPWDEASATAAIRAVLWRIDAAWTQPNVFAGDARLADLEEAFHIAAMNQDVEAFEAALSAYETYCVGRYRDVGTRRI
jgi:hypothetical protein